LGQSSKKGWHKRLVVEGVARRLRCCLVDALKGWFEVTWSIQTSFPSHHNKAPSMADPWVNLMDRLRLFTLGLLRKAYTKSTTCASLILHILNWSFPIFWQPGQGSNP
jgi:hypothetical protein